MSDTPINDYTPGQIRVSWGMCILAGSLLTAGTLLVISTLDPNVRLANELEWKVDAVAKKVSASDLYVASLEHSHPALYTAIKFIRSGIVPQEFIDAAAAHVNSITI